MAGDQNKAIFVFTALALVFLPLSFSASYFGMNLKGLTDMDRTVTDIWKVCETVSFCIILQVILLAFRYRIATRLSP
ncbi:hypothetical protein N657DRAFT_647380 [Parathielavia appendiculata]|uniref:Uncharacterized protein n=1 Tax=Parathielavia appendiculata TaxID=2587402 RepID=A0AAN6Z1B0_9PEZI|nr:hypothetical protein N657DRAFT_647380 [Parathielavia appendiculata]